VKKVVVFISLVFYFLGCGESKPHKSYDAKKLIEQKCSSCHNLDLPPTLYEEELAPPMMAVAHHIFNKVEVKDESLRVSNSVAFVKEYVMAPDVKKSFCDEESLKSYGLMPSQKGNLTLEELDAIANYMFSHFTQENLSHAQEALNKFNAMPKGEQIARKNGCFGCHRVEKSIVGPSFKAIQVKYEKSPQTLIKSIKEGSRGKWSSAKGVMPAFKKLDEEELKSLSSWILKR